MENKADKIFKCITSDGSFVMKDKYELTITDLLAKLNRPFPMSRVKSIMDMEISGDDTVQIKKDAFEFKKKLYNDLDMYMDDGEIDILPDDILYREYQFKLDKHMAEVDILARIKKDKAHAEAVRKWSFQEMSEAAFVEANKIVRRLGKEKFIMDAEASRIWNLLCLYFTDNKDFNKIPLDLQPKNSDTRYFDLRKPIMIIGDVGTGKSTILRAFSKNKKQCFIFKAADDIADEANDKNSGGIGSLRKYSVPLAWNAADENTFYQKQLGWLLDDIGTENNINHMGTKADCIDIILRAYYAYITKDDGYAFGLHLTTNLTMPQIEERYGVRLRDRFRETHNIIVYEGGTRR